MHGEVFNGVISTTSSVEVVSSPFGNEHFSVLLPFITHSTKDCLFSVTKFFRVRRCLRYGKVAHSTRSGSGRISNVVGLTYTRRWEVPCIIFFGHFFPGSFSAIEQHKVALAEVAEGQVESDCKVVMA